MTRKLTRSMFAATGILALLMLGCGKPPEAPAPTPAPAPAEVPAPVAPPAPEAAVAIAQIAGPAGSAISGTVTFRDTGNGIAIEAKISGLSPGSHGFHVHEKGDCSGDFSAAGGHFNPDAHSHAGPDAAEAHAGDLGNLRVPDVGVSQLTMMSRRFTLDEGPNGIIGKSVIIHASEDDLATQPTGNSGARIACGLIALQATPSAAPTGESGADNH